ncbi:hypothetical protein PFISCL1PPCAC_24932, partial [Pristionchus fissidentatus]
LFQAKECSAKMLEQADRQREEMNELNEKRLREQEENTAKVDGIRMEQIEMTKGFAGAMINLTISNANSRESGLIVELSNALRAGLNETKSIHNTAVEATMIALNDFNYAPASVHLGQLGLKVDRVDQSLLTFGNALNRANSGCMQMIDEQMNSIGNLELALGSYRRTIGSLKAKMAAKMPCISQSDVDELSQAQEKLMMRMIEMPRIQAVDSFGEIAST